MKHAEKIGGVRRHSQPLSLGKRGTARSTRHRASGVRSRMKLVRPLVPIERANDDRQGVVCANDTPIARSGRGEGRTFYHDRERPRHGVARLVPVRALSAGPRRERGRRDPTPRPIYIYGVVWSARVDELHPLAGLLVPTDRPFVVPATPQRLLYGECTVRHAIEWPAAPVVALAAPGNIVPGGSRGA